jgi:hypothetical protein
MKKPPFADCASRWNTTTTLTPQPIMAKERFFYEALNLFPVDGKHTKTHKINAGRHEWDFKFTLPGNSDESVEGLVTNWIVYSLNATVDRGYMSKQLIATSHIRVIRTLGRDLMESMPMEQVRLTVCGTRGFADNFIDKRRHLGFQDCLQDHSSSKELYSWNIHCGRLYADTPEKGG